MEEDSKTLICNKCKSTPIKPAAWFCFAAGLIIILMIFSCAKMVARQNPLFAVHNIALERDIDTNAYYYTDSEEFTVAEQWMVSSLTPPGNSKSISISEY